MGALFDRIKPSFEAHPDRPAVTSGNVSLSYAEFMKRIDDHLSILNDHHITSGQRVGVCLPKSIDSLAAILAILKHDCAYVPVASDQPFARVRSILSSAGVSGVFTTDGFQTEENGVVDDQHAYILYTSGSTGVPKGVPMTDDNALAFIDWAIGEFAFDHEDVFSSHAPFQFDLSIFDIYVGLAVGGHLILFDEKESRHPATLTGAIAEHGISVWYSTPTVLQLMMKLGDLGAVDASSIRYVFFAGEVFPQSGLKGLMSAVPGATYVNLYGPTETNVCAFHVVQDDEYPVPIGKACSGNELRMNGSELLVRGRSVMDGYVDSSLDESAFLTLDGERWYRTGDEVRTNELGEFVYVGRTDRMVKRRGYRIELDEIQHQLASIDEVSQVAVVSKVQDDEVLIVAFLVADPISNIALKTAASKRLPLYMMPDETRIIDKLPLTATNKVDLKALEAQV